MGLICFYWLNAEHWREYLLDRGWSNRNATLFEHYWRLNIEQVLPSPIPPDVLFKFVALSLRSGRRGLVPLTYHALSSASMRARTDTRCLAF